MASNNTVVLHGLGRGCHGEAKANAAITPGMLIERMSTGKVRAHALAGTKPAMLFAKEDALQGRTLSTAYSADELVGYHEALPGDRINALVPANALAIVKGDKLASNGDGTFVLVKDSERLLYSNTAESAEHENTTDAADFDKSYTIPANFLQAGDVLRISGHVTVNDNNSTDTLTLVLKIGSVTIVTSAALDVADSDIFQFNAEVIVRSIGATGKIVAQGYTAYDAAGTDTEPNNFVLAETTLDTTGTNKIAVNADWSVAHADNEASLTMLVVELIRAGGVPLVEALEAVDNSAGSSVARCAVQVL